MSSDSMLALIHLIEPVKAVLTFNFPHKLDKIWTQRATVNAKQRQAWQSVSISAWQGFASALLASKRVQLRSNHLKSHHQQSK